MSATPDNTLTDPKQLIADLRRRLAEARGRADRDRRDRAGVMSGGGASFGHRLAAMRKHRSLTHAELAAAGQARPTDDLGLGERVDRITPADITKIARALRCRHADLLAPPEAPIPRYPFWARNKRKLQRIAAETGRA